MNPALAEQAKQLFKEGVDTDFKEEHLKQSVPLT